MNLQGRAFALAKGLAGRGCSTINDDQVHIAFPRSLPSLSEKGSRL